ncbi:hypothetical protein JXB01_03835, partial [Candidatus Micrarchaeota archaeon]|nr:hypothetical protein [Candidatus Micrarchaeota archaeon]
MILKKIKNGNMKIIGDGKNHIPFVHVSDAARAVAGSLKAETGVYNLVGEQKTQEAIYRIAAKELGTEAPIEKIPVAFALASAKLEETKSVLTGSKPKLTSEHILILASDRRFNCSKAKEKLGFNPRSIKDGIKEMAALV